MGEIVTIGNQKGGVGKTTSTINIGTALAKQGKRVLLIDIDPQANLTRGMGITVKEDDYTIYDVLLNPKEGLAYAIRTTYSGVDVVPSTLLLTGAENELYAQIGRESLLRDALEQTRSAYDYILIDAPPALGIFTLNALTTSDWVLLVLEMGVYAFDGIDQFEQTIALVRKINPLLRIGGVLCTRKDARTNLGAVMEEKARKRYGNLVYQTVIPENAKVAESPAHGKAVIDTEPASAGAKAYLDVVYEIIEHHGK